jgi:hypothetical protein
MAYVQQLVADKAGDFADAAYFNHMQAGIGTADANATTALANAATAQALVEASVGASISVEAYGAKGNVKTITDAKITTGTKALSSVGTVFAAVDVGKTVNVTGAGAEVETNNTKGEKVKVRLPLIATISSVAGGVATVSVAAGATVAGATCTYGTDDSAAFEAAAAAGKLLKLRAGANYAITPVEGGAVGGFKPLAGTILEGYGSTITALASTSEEPKTIYCAGSTIFKGVTIENTYCPASAPIGVQGGAACPLMIFVDCTIRGFGFQGKTWNASTTRVVMRSSELEGNQSLTTGSFGFNHAGTTGSELIVDDCYVHHNGDNGEELHCHGLYMYQEVAFIITRTRFNHAKGRYAMSFGHAVAGSQAPAFAIYRDCVFGSDYTSASATQTVISNGMIATLFAGCVWNTPKTCVLVTGDCRFVGCTITCTDAAHRALEWSEPVETEKAFTADTTNGSNVLKNVSEFTACINGETLEGAGIPAGTTIEAYDSVAKTITMTANATATAATVAITRKKPSSGFRVSFQGGTIKATQQALSAKGFVRAVGTDFSSSNTGLAQVKVNEGTFVGVECGFGSPKSSAGAVEAFSNSTVKLIGCRLDPTLTAGIGVENKEVKLVLLLNDFSQTGATLVGETPTTAPTALLNYGSTGYTGTSTLRGTATLAGTPGKITVANPMVSAASVITVTQRSGAIIKTGLKATPEAGKFTLEAGEASTAEVAWELAA